MNVKDKSGVISALSQKQCIRKEIRADEKDLRITFAVRWHICFSEVRGGP